MANKLHLRFIKTLNVLTPGVSVDLAKSLTILKKQGLVECFQKSGGNAAEFAEVAEILTR